jgi:hypothetical protein
VSIAASWAIGASLYIFFSPISAQVVTARQDFGNSTDIVETISREQSWYQAQGLWGVCVLAVFAGFYLLVLRLAWRGHYTAVAMLSVISIALSIVAGFSIGGAYLPAASVLMIGAVLLLSSRILR